MILLLYCGSIIIGRITCVGGITRADIVSAMGTRFMRREDETFNGDKAILHS